MCRRVSCENYPLTLRPYFGYFYKLRFRAEVDKAVIARLLQYQPEQNLSSKEYWITTCLGRCRRKLFHLALSTLDRPIPTKLNNTLMQPNP